MKLKSLGPLLMLGLIVLEIEADRFLRRWMPATVIAVFLIIAIAMYGEARHRGLVQRARRGLCIKCGYDLTGNTSGVCPECGTSLLAPRKS